MSGETRAQESGWTTDTLKEHFDKLREADQRALQIKEAGDAKALDLAREIQVYKDEKANQLREQINSERGLYVSQIQFKPIADYITAQQGHTKASEVTMGKVYAAIAAMGTIIGIVVLLANGVFNG
jgi:vacuolar-type H+-ATPase subunit H